MLVFIIANLPLPLILALNILAAKKYFKLRKLKGKKKLEKPERLIIGGWLNNLAIPFTWLPVIIEQRIFVQNPTWLISYGIAAALSISGLLLLNSGLNVEIKTLKPRRRRATV